jgi:outer membrane protein
LLHEHWPTRPPAAVAAASIAALLVFAPAICAAETLLDAIRMAYETNPSLQAQQAQQRATDETYVQARAGYGPQVSLNGQFGYQAARVDQLAGPFSPGTTARYQASTGSGTLSLAQPLYTFGAVRAQVETASANIAAGRQGLRQAEAQLLLGVITAYEDVRRDRESLRILQTEIDALDHEHQETKARVEAGDLTRTDDAQSEARLLAARAQLLAARGQLDSSNAAYVNLVGQNPGSLAPPPELPGMPSTADDAFAIAERDNPQLLGAMDSERAADAEVKQAKSAFGPTVSLQVNVGVAPVTTYAAGLYSRDVTAAAVVSMPLFTSGLNSSKVRQATENDNRAELDVFNARRTVVQLVARSWDQLVTNRGAISLDEREVEAQATAREGNQAEQQVGLRRTIDVLNAELELANAQIGLAQARHDAYVAGATLLAAMGRLEARNLMSGAPIYDPAVSAKRAMDRPMAPWVGAVATVDSIAAPSGNKSKPDPRGPTAQAVRPSVAGAEVVN